MDTSTNREALRAKLRGRLRDQKNTRSGHSSKKTTDAAVDAEDLKGKQQDALLTFAGDDPEKLKMVQMVLKNPNLLGAMMKDATNMAADDDDDEEEAPPPS